MTHPQTELIAHLRGELGQAERRQVEAHLEACVACRREYEALRQVLAALAAPTPEAEPHWGRYRAELREKLEARRAPRRWLLRPLPLALSAAMAGVLVAVFWLGGDREASRNGLTPVEQAVLGERLDMLRQYRVLQQLDMLEDLDLIGQLDRLEG